jgi:endonuclease/exonuclease/phosphatase family metal-dependent hydrolase
MRFRVFYHSIRNLYSRLTSTAICALAILVFPACDDERQTPSWDRSENKIAAVTETLNPVEDQSRKSDAPRGIALENPSSETPSQGLRFISYNVENWLKMDRYVDHQSLKDAPKPESEKQAVVKILVHHAPDIIGLSEIGETADLAEIQDKLKAAGLHFPHSHYTGGSDPTRHLGLLSRFPIISTVKPAEQEYQLAGQTHAINRGILDATIKANDKFYRFIGVHLKSKRESEQGDQELIRLNEARLLRRHVNSIFKIDADARLIVYGDFNDTRGTPTVKTITGNYNDPTYLTAIPAKDSRGDAWTHHWSTRDIYSRIDFITVTRALRKEVNFPAAKIIDDVEWNQASDHRPILAIFK